MAKSEASIDSVFLPLIIRDLGSNHAARQNIYDSQIEKRLNELWDLYRLNVYTGVRDSWDTVDTTLVGLTNTQTLEVLNLLRVELAKDPISVVRDLSITRYRLVSSLLLTDKNRKVGGLTYDKGLVYIVFNPDNLAKTRDTVHHENMHCSDYVFRVYDPKTDKLQRVHWLSLNPQGEQVYIGESYWDMTSEQLAELDTTGFISVYGRVSLEEDRATIAGMLKTDPSTLFNKAERDDVLNRKLQILLDDFWVRSNGLMGKEYFDDLAAGRVKLNYWRSREKRSLRKIDFLRK